MQFCVRCGRGDRTLAAKSVDRGHLAALGRGAGNDRESGAQCVYVNCISAYQFIHWAIAADPQVCMHVCASAVVTESTSGVAFPSLHLVAFGRQGEKMQPLPHTQCIGTNCEFRLQVALMRQRMCRVCVSTSISCLHVP